MAVKPVRKLTPLPIKAVTFTGGYWGERLRVNHAVTLPIAYKRCKETGRIDAFRMDWKPGRPNEPHKFWDSDVGKWVEAAAYDLAGNPDPRRRKQLQEVAELIASAQQKDGYLNVHYTLVEPKLRWANVRDNHEMYCAGHLMEGAVAHWQATGDRTLLDAMAGYADYIATVFGRGKGQKRGYCGHQEIELALVKMYRATGEKKFLKLAKYFIDERRLVAEDRRFRWDHFLTGMHARGGFEDPRLFPLAWAVVIDLVCLSFLIWVVSGLYMWWTLPGLRKWGWAAVLGGVASFAWFLARL
jgi:hypothetical protein